MENIDQLRCTNTSCDCGESTESGRAYGTFANHDIFMFTNKSRFPIGKALLRAIVITVAAIVSVLPSADAQQSIYQPTQTPDRYEISRHNVMNHGSTHQQVILHGKPNYHYPHRTIGHYETIDKAHGVEKGRPSPDKSRSAGDGGSRVPHWSGPRGGLYGNRKVEVVPPNEDGGQGEYDADDDECAVPCARGEFACSLSCTCVYLHERCDGVADCARGEDEAGCARACDEEDGHLPCPGTGACISRDWLCDGDNDCGDFSDETKCVGQNNCTSDQVECSNGLCVPRAWQCDGDNDCRDNSDELNCTSAGCTENEFPCGSGQCVSLLWRCDKESDCPDNSDEADCPVQVVTCGEGETACARGGCTRSDFRCDGDNDCGDWSDEDGCPASPGSCIAGEFKCPDGKCVPSRWRCDGEPDCSDGGDERGCGPNPARNCLPDEHTCNDGKCILLTWVCDGVADCAGGEDENGCSVKCEEGQHMCRTHGNRTAAASSAFRACVDRKHVCDGQRDCPLGDDEEKCSRRRECDSDSRCEKLCITTHDDKPACACPPGYSLAEDQYSCRDIDECMYEQDPVCSQACTNSEGSYSCGCMTGYVLRPDLRTCKAVGAAPTLLFSNRVNIRQVSLSGDRYTSMIKGLHNAVALDYHYKKKLIFWSEIFLDVIRMSYINGTNITDVIRWGLDAPGGVAVDWIHDLLLWTDAGTRRVEVASLDGRARAVIVAGDLDKPRAIAVHPGEAFVFWTDWGPNPKIERADIDGSNRMNIISDSIFWPNGLTIDYTTSRVYWADAKHHVIESTNFNGKDRKKVTNKGLPHPYAITMFEDALYWTDWHTKSISTINKNTGVGFQTVYSGLNVPMDIHSYHPQRQPSYANHCGRNNGGCSHLCLPNHSSYTCRCPLGANLIADRKSCEESPEKLLLFARKKDIRIKQLTPTKKSETVDMVIPLDGIKSAVALAWDHHTNSIFWTDVEKNTINKAFLNGSKQEVIINSNLISPAGLAYDWVGHKIYWTDAGTNRIEVANADGSMRTMLCWEQIDKPRDIVLDPLGGYMYWSDWGQSPCIEAAAMDGTSRKRIIKGNLTWPNGLALDLERGRLYWSDGGTKTIEHSKLDGTDRVILIGQDLHHPFGLDLYGDEIYWTDWDSPTIQAANKVTGGGRRTLSGGIADLMDVRVFHKDRVQGVNRCGNNNGGCSHLCLLRPAGFSCACPIGIKLGSNLKTCANGPMNYLIFAHRVDIRQVSLDVPYLVDVVLPLPPMKRALAVDVDRVTGEVYWTDTAERIIHKSSKDRKHTINVISTGLRTADGLVLDSTGRKIYWTDAGRNTIEVAELDGLNRKVLVWTDLDNPRAITLHYHMGLMFWSDWGKNARIEQADMDGQNRKVIIDNNLQWPNGLAIDRPFGRLYWNDAKRMMIESSDFSGKDRRVVLSEVPFPYGLVVVGSHVYWTDWKTKSLHRADKLTGRNNLVIRDKLEGLMDIRAVQVDNIVQNACSINNGGCSHLCIRSPGGYKCACPTGILFHKKISTNSSQPACKNHPEIFLIFATKTNLAMISLDTELLLDVSLPTKDIKNSVALDFHWERKLIFYTDVTLNVIRSVDMNNQSDYKTIISHNLDTPNGLGIDWIADNMYWTDNDFKVLEVARLDGSCRKILISKLDEPRSLVLHPRKGYVYWSDWGDMPRIERAWLDGTERKIIVKTDLGFPNGLTLDYDNEQLYWTDALKNRIETSDLNGEKRVQLVPEATHPFGMTQFGNYIYWTDWYKKSVLRAHKTSGKENLVFVNTDNEMVMEIKAVAKQRQDGWNPCKENNGYCTHLCLYKGDNYTCACPDLPDVKTCSIVPKQWVVPRFTEPASLTTPRPSHANTEDTKMKYAMYLGIGIIKISFFAALVFGCYKYFKRKSPISKEEFGDKAIRTARNQRVISFPNPNYGAEGPPEGSDGCLSTVDRRRGNRFPNIFKYDRSQERVTNLYSPEDASLIPLSSDSQGSPSLHCVVLPQRSESQRNAEGFRPTTLHPIG